MADRAASTDEAEKRELVWKNGSESKFLFCASETEGTTWEKRSCLLFMVTKAAFEVRQDATLPQALEKKRLLQLGDNWVVHGQKLLLVKGTNQRHHRPGEKVVGLEA